MDPTAGAATADDRVLPLTRWVAAAVVPFLVLAFLPLYLRPDLTGTHFTWTVAPDFTAFWMGSGYLGGAWFFFNVARGRRWHEATLGVLPVAAFVWVMLAATLLHWDRIVPAGLRVGMAVIGIVLIATALWMFMLPTAAMAAWSWKLTPLTARVMAGWLSLSGVGGLVLAAESRWSAWRVLIQSMLLWLALLSVGVWRARDGFDLARPAIAAVWAVPTSLLGLGAIYLYFESGRAGRR